VLGTTDLLVRVLTAVHSVFNADAKSWFAGRKS
jgi:hypothetical protein